MGFISSAAFAMLGLVSLTVSDAETPKGLILAQASPFASTQGYVAQPVSDYMTTADGCTYRRTQAPGYPARWILVINPGHIGRPNASGRCKGMM